MIVAVAVFWGLLESPTETAWAPLAYSSPLIETLPGEDVTGLGSATAPAEATL